MNRCGKGAGAFALAFALACSAACGSSGSRPVPTPLTGYLVIQDAHGAVWQITLHKQGHFTYTRITPRTGRGPGDAALSPDGQILAYGTGSGLALLNVRTGAKIPWKSPPPGPVSCLSWSPDSTHLAVLTGAGSGDPFQTDTLGRPSQLDSLILDSNNSPPGNLYITSATGRPVLLATTGSEGNYLTAGAYYKTLTCGHWIDADHLVFIRYSGDLPAQITTQNGDVVAPKLTNTTTVATASATGYDLTNSATNWSVLATCGRWAITTNFKSFFAGPITSYDGAGTRLLPGSFDTSAVMFVRSPCQVLALTVDQSGPSPSCCIVTQIDPGTGRVTGKWQIDPSGLDPAVLAPSPNGGAVIALGCGGDGEFFDLAAGQAYPIHFDPNIVAIDYNGIGSCGGGLGYTILGWTK